MEAQVEEKNTSGREKTIQPSQANEDSVITRAEERPQMEPYRRPASLLSHAHSAPRCIVHVPWPSDPRLPTAQTSLLPFMPVPGLRRRRWRRRPGRPCGGPCNSQACRCRACGGAGDAVVRAVLAAGRATAKRPISTAGATGQDRGRRPGNHGAGPSGPARRGGEGGFGAAGGGGPGQEPERGWGSE